MSAKEKEFANFLESLAPGILSTTESVLQKSIPADALNKIFDPLHTYKDKVEIIKPFLKQPVRTALVATLPELDKKPVRFSPPVFKVIELLYVLRCIIAVMPGLEELCDSIIVKIESNISNGNISVKASKEIIDAVTALRGLDAPISAVASAASKIFYSVDGMAFDEFSISLSVVEWELITANMNAIRLENADSVRKLSCRLYNETTSKRDKVAHKKALDAKISKAQITLVKILKIRIEDLHRSDQMSILTKMSIDESAKGNKFTRKQQLSIAKKKILLAYRKDENLDVKKYVKENAVLTE
jgi:hypothetical protein